MRNFYFGVYIMSQMAAAVAAFTVLYMTCYVAVDVLTRGLFAAATVLQHGVVWHALVIACVWSLGYALEQGNLIRTGLRLDRLPIGVQQKLTAGAAFFVCAVAIGLAWMCWVRVAEAMAGEMAISSASVLPVWIADGALMMGVLFFALAALAHGLRHITGHPSPAPQRPLRLQID